MTKKRNKIESKRKRKKTILEKKKEVWLLFANFKPASNQTQKFEPHPSCTGVCIWWYILQNYKYKLHFQNLSIYHIPHVFIQTMAAENLNVRTACDSWDSNIQLTMVKDWKWQVYPNVVQCLNLTVVDCHRKCHLNRK